MESRETPSPATVSAAFNALPTAVNNLQASLAARPANANNINKNLGPVVNDFAILKLGAGAFDVGDRLRIDSALIREGFIVLYDGFYNHGFLPAPQFVSTVQVGATAIQAGIRDLLVTSFFPNTSGNAVLT
ncbi:MAG: hypothetical protein ACYC3I_20810 [Gemmataceae bacterium]